MDDNKHSPGDGDVPLVLGGERLKLVPSLEACMAISKLAGNSMAQALVRVMDRIDFEFIVEIVAIGIEATSPHLKKQVRERVYRQGVLSITGPVVLYLRTIMNGGARPNDDWKNISIDLIDQLGATLPQEMSEAGDQLDAIRRSIVEQMISEEGGSEEQPDPLAESKSPLESSIDA